MGFTQRGLFERHLRLLGPDKRSSHQREIDMY